MAPPPWGIPPPGPPHPQAHMGDESAGSGPRSPNLMVDPNLQVEADGRRHEPGMGGQHPMTNTATEVKKNRGADAPKRRGGRASAPSNTSSSSAKQQQSGTGHQGGPRGRASAAGQQQQQQGTGQRQGPVPGVDTFYPPAPDSGSHDGSGVDGNANGNRGGEEGGDGDAADPTSTNFTTSSSR